MAVADKGVEELLERLLEGRSPKELVDSGGLLEDLTKRLYEKALEGEMERAIPRDREGTFEAVLVPKGQRRLPGFDEKGDRPVCPGNDDAGDPGPSEGDP